MKNAAAQTPIRQAIACLTFAVPKGGAAIQIMPAGEFRPTDGRPLACGSWKLTPQIAARLVAEANARANKYVIDYEHQTQLADTNGHPAPAAGWFKPLEYRAGDGLYAASVEWTARAKGYIDGDEYKYISPVFSYDSKTGEVQKLISVALTNNPGLDGMDEVTLAALTVRFLTPTFNPSLEKTMNPLLLALLKALGLTETATEAEAVSAVATLKAKSDSVDGLTTQIATLKSATPDPGKWVALERFTELSTEVARLSASNVNREVEELLTTARNAGKCTPVVEAVWRDVGKNNVAQLKALIDAQPGNPVLAGQSQTTGKPVAERDPKAPATADELAMCKHMGLTIEEFRAAQVIA